MRDRIRAGGEIVALALLCYLTAAHVSGCFKPGPAPAPPPPLIAFTQESVEVEAGNFADLELTTQGEDVEWHFPPGLNHRASGKAAWVGSPRDGRYVVLAWTAVKGRPTPAAVCVVIVGKPVPPVPPAPPVPPVPPVPPAPIPSDGLRVLIVYESQDLGKYKAGQLAAMFGEKTRAYMTAKCVKGADGKTPEFRVWDKDVNTTKESKLWQEFMALPRPSLPWIFVANGDKGASQALPEVLEETVKLLESVGGK